MPDKSQCAVCQDVIIQLRGHPNSRLDGDNGLAAATMRRITQLEDACRIALWIRDRLQGRGSFGAGFEEWRDIENAADVTPGEKGQR